jgi:hypothetical protein
MMADTSCGGGSIRGGIEMRKLLLLSTFAAVIVALGSGLFDIGASSVWPRMSAKMC